MAENIDSLTSQPSESGRLIEAFNAYSEFGGEELIADKILGLLSEKYEVESIRWHSADWKGAQAPGKLMQIAKMFYNRDSMQRLRNAAEAGPIRAIIAHNVYPIGSPSFYLEARRQQIPVIQFIHNFRPFSVNGTLWTGTSIAASSLDGNYGEEIRLGSWQGSKVKSALFAMMLKWLHFSGALDSVKCWIAISDFMREKFIHAGIAPERIVTLKHYWEPSAQPANLSDGGYYLFIGRLVVEKGVKVLIEAWKQLENQLGEKCPPLVVAGTGDLEEYVVNEAERSDRIEYRGYVSGQAKSDLISGARALLAPSIWWEPLGLVTYEAYDNCKPMLAAASGGLSETVEDGVTGLTYQPNDSGALAEAIVRLEDYSAAERREMGMAGHKWLSLNASKEEWLKKIQKILVNVSQREYQL